MVEDIDLIEKEQKNLTNCVHNKGKSKASSNIPEESVNENTFTQDNDNAEIGFVYLKNPNDNTKESVNNEFSIETIEQSDQTNNENSVETNSINSNDSRLNEHVN